MQNRAVNSIQSNMTNYKETCRTFHLEAPEYYNFGLDTIDRWAEDPNKLGLVWISDAGREERFTFADLKERSDRFAAALLELGLCKGDRVLLVMGRTPAWHVCLLGMLKAGIVAVPGTMLLSPKDIRWRLQTAHCKAVVVDSDIAPRVEEVRRDIPDLQVLITTGESSAGWLSFQELLNSAKTASFPRTRISDPALIYFSSGTTGAPKMVLHTHAYAIGHNLTGRFWLDLKPEDLHWNLSDTGWAKAAWSSFFGPWSQGAAIFFPELKGKFQPSQVLAMLEKYPITTFCAPPTAFRSFVQENLNAYSFPRLRHCVSAGEPLNPEVIEAWSKATGKTIYDGYGQTESVCLVGNYPCVPVKPGSMGKPIPGFEIAIVDVEGAVVETGREGDIAVRVKPDRPVGMFQEYLDAPELNAAVHRGDWYITGDRGIRDCDGYFWFVGRADDVIITAGYRVGPFEVESSLLEHPAVAEAAAVAKPDSMRGNIIKAFVVLAQGYVPSEDLVSELQEYVKSTTAPYKYPREIEFVRELPKTISGKILRRQLRDLSATNRSDTSTEV